MAIQFDKIFKKRVINVTILMLLFFSTFNIVLAAFTQPVGGDLDKEMTKQFERFRDRAGFSNQPTSIETSIAKMIEYLLSFLGVIFIILIIYAGFLWMTASGDEEQITKAKDIMKNVIIGLVIVLGAYVITQTIVKYIATAAKV